MVEDCPTEMDVTLPEANNQTPAALLIPPLLAQLQSPTEKFKCRSLSTLNYMASYRFSGFVDAHMNAYVQVSLTPIAQETVGALPSIVGGGN